ncbi:McrC family protein [Saccharomonospora xinjiangensis]|uniref:McrC family protein n=1 Tax=Saccharomonospora xinjiangensis TaxID=75294 RepID=UPI0010C425A3|nr:McrC family protein [Saccharomonospora xinjiangensis]QBQ60330.1 McrBC 5-methylcytosine restriction system component [Saccharomonospora xinjiangensis]
MKGTNGSQTFRVRVRLHHGRPVPVEIAHDEHTAVIAENRLLRDSGEALLRLPGLPGDVRGRLLRLRVMLGEITPIRRGNRVPAWWPSRLNTRYHDALRLAELVLRGVSIEHRPGEVTVHGFLFDLAKVFEDFATRALRDATGELDDFGGHCVRQATHHLDERQTIRIVPDLVVYTAGGAPVAVADAKYKVEKPAGFSDTDLYQMLAHCTALNLPEGHLVYAKGNAPHGAHRVRHAGVTLHQHALDLDQPPAGVLTDVRAVARRLTAR